MITEMHEPGTEPAAASEVRVPRRLAGAFGYAVALVPATLIALGSSRPGRFWGRYEQRLLRNGDQRDAVSGRRPMHCVLSLMLGAVGLLALGATALFVARGVLYGFVDDGPYDDAWGGPTLAGAWAVHLAVALGAQAVVLALSTGVTRLHRTATAWLRGDALPRWFVPTAMLTCAAVALFLVAFVRQL